MSSADGRDLPPPVYEAFDSEAAFNAALERLLAQPGRELRIFDPDLVALRFERAERVERLRDFLRGGQARRLSIVLHDTAHLTRHCPRMMNLLALFAHAIQVYRTGEELRELQDAFLVLDDAHYLRRPVAQFFRGALGLNDRGEALAMRSRFLEIWAASHPAVSATTLGL